MIAYLIDNEGYITDKINCQPSPLEPGKYFVPRNAIGEPLPKIKENETVRWNGVRWIVVCDFSQKNYYAKINGELKKFKRSEKFSDLYTDVPPPVDLTFPIWKDGEWIQDPQRHSEFFKQKTRETRNELLKESDIYMLEDYPMAYGEKELIKRYRKYLRDFTKVSGWENVSVLTLDEWKNAKL
jgi:hypothetical protein